MGNGNNTIQWKPLVAILLITCVASWALANRARAARMNLGAVRADGYIKADYVDGLELGAKILAFAVSVAGFFGISKGAMGLLRSGDVDTASLASSVVGVGGVLAGATILGKDTIGVGIAFGGLALGTSVFGIARLVKNA